jgi:hypothetical protein
VPGASLESITGRLGVGSIALLGLFMLFDGQTSGVYLLVERYGKSTSWGILGVIPTVVVTYILGVFCVGLAEVVFGRFRSLRSPAQPDAILTISAKRSALLDTVYSEQLRDHELLKGASIAFLILAAGCLGEAPNMGAYPMLVWLSALGAVVSAALSLLFARKAALRAQHFVATLGEAKLDLPSKPLERSGAEQAGHTQGMARRPLSG